MSDLISRQATIDALCDNCDHVEAVCPHYPCKQYTAIEDLPSTQPESISEAYAKAVFAWLINYQIKAAELEGRYTPYEVLSWVANDWRKENEIN